MPLCAHRGDIPFERQYGKHMLAAPNSHSTVHLLVSHTQFFSQQVEK